ncbi:MAG: hypothetical protein HQK54_14940, partial [Oligoflexales bacterium]|nr:hypothetical protein [Oligoflexales bacterium]
QDFLETWGKNWRKTAPSHFLDIFNSKGRHLPENRKHVVILNRILADVYNKGYETNQNLILDNVNDVPVESLEHLNNLLLKARKENVQLVRFLFKPADISIIMEFNELPRAQLRIARHYGIPMEDFWGMTDVMENPASFEQKTTPSK